MNILTDETLLEQRIKAEIKEVELWQQLTNGDPEKEYTALELFRQVRLSLAVLRPISWYSILDGIPAPEKEDDKGRRSRYSRLVLARTVNNEKILLMWDYEKLCWVDQEKEVYSLNQRKVTHWSYVSDPLTDILL